MKSSKIKLSICIPTLNRGAFIGATLESIVCQVTDEVEIIIVDGGSRDNTRDVVHEFQKDLPSLRYMCSKEQNSGPNSVAPSGTGFDRDCCLAVEMAQGDYCWLFTDDDFLKPGAIPKVLEATRHQYELIVVNAEVRSADLSRPLQASRLQLTADRVYTPTEWENLFVDTADYLSFVGGVVIKRQVWKAREKEPYIGTGFIHFGTVFQSPLPGDALVIAESLITIRYGEALYMRTSRYFEICMIIWPNLIWSLPNFSDFSKGRVCPREPWRKKKTLLLFRAKGAFSSAEYEHWLKNRVDSRWERLVARFIAVFPGSAINLVAVLRYFLSSRLPGQYLLDLQKSPFYFARALRSARVSSIGTALRQPGRHQVTILGRGIKMITRITCRVCGGSLDPILTLGDQYVSTFLSPEQPDGPKAPLDLVLCQQCRLLQLRHTVPGDVMYQNYWYRSGTNQTMRNALADISGAAAKLVHLTTRDSVLDIGCNDGTLLGSYTVPGIYKIGFDPAQNLAVLSRRIADKVLVGFFDADRFLADPELQKLRPKIVTSIAMFYDLEDPNKFVSDIQRILHREGVWIVQMSYLPLMLKQNDFGNICHEHLEYYSLHSLEYLLHRHGFSIVDAQLNDVNGGSIRAFIRNRAADPCAFGDEAYREQAAERVTKLRQSEAELGLDATPPYREFAERVQAIKQQVRDFIRDQVEHKKKVFVYGASTKGNTMLQYFGLDNSLINAAAERNPDKWGMVTVGTRIPIISEAEARAARPDYFLVLPWHFIEEFKTRERDYLSSTGKFIVPLPKFAVI